MANFFWGDTERSVGRIGGAKSILLQHKEPAVREMARRIEKGKFLDDGVSTLAFNIGPKKLIHSPLPPLDDVVPRQDKVVILTKEDVKYGYIKDEIKLPVSSLYVAEVPQYTNKNVESKTLYIFAMVRLFSLEELKSRNAAAGNMWGKRVHRLLELLEKATEGDALDIFEGRKTFIEFGCAVLKNDKIWRQSLVAVFYWIRKHRRLKSQYVLELSEENILFTEDGIAHIRDFLLKNTTSNINDTMLSSVNRKRVKIEVTIDKKAEKTEEQKKLLVQLFADYLTSNMLESKLVSEMERVNT